MSTKVGADDFITENGATAATLTGLPRVETWPVLADAALHGLAGRVVEAMGPHTEAADVATLAYFLTSFGNLLGPSPYALVAHDQHPCRFNMALVGQTAKGRKGTARSIVMALLKKVDEAWWAQCTATGMSTGEGLIYAVRDAREGVDKEGEPITVDAGVDDKRLLVDEPELAVVLTRMEREGNSLSAIIRQGWDTGDLRVLTRKEPLRATGAHISIMANITMEELRSTLTATERANGFANRFLFFLVKRSKVLPEPEPVPGPTLEALAAELRDVMKFAETITVIERDTAARALWAAIYEKLSAERPGILGAVTARAEAHVLRLSVIYAVLDRSPLVRPEHLRAAIAAWEYADASAARIFGDRLGNAIADVILEALGAREAMTRTEIRDLFGRNMPKDRIDAALAMLQAARLVRRKPPEATGGRPAEAWEAITQ